MTERFLIAKTKLGKTLAGKPVGHLYSTDTRLRYPVLILFDLSMLKSVGIDPNTLDEQGVVGRYWAYYEESTTKKTSKGRPYLDVLYLEPIDKPATSTSTDTSALLVELREIKNLLQYLVNRLIDDSPPATSPRSPAPSPAPAPAPDDHQDDNNDHFADVTLTDTPPPEAADPKLSANEAREKFYALTVAADGVVEQRQINALLTYANSYSFADALVKLQNLVERKTK